MINMSLELFFDKTLDSIEFILSSELNFFFIVDVFGFFVNINPLGNIFEL